VSSTRVRLLYGCAELFTLNGRCSADGVDGWSRLGRTHERVITHHGALDVFGFPRQVKHSSGSLRTRARALLASRCSSVKFGSRSPTHIPPPRAQLPRRADIDREYQSARGRRKKIHRPPKKIGIERTRERDAGGVRAARVDPVR